MLSRGRVKGSDGYYMQSRGMGHPNKDTKFKSLFQKHCAVLPTTKKTYPWHIWPAGVHWVVSLYLILKINYSSSYEVSVTGIRDQVF